jgi:RNA polymerase sigma-70 factor, ECF subfamily
MAQEFCGRSELIGEASQILNADTSAMALKGLHVETDADLLAAATRRDAAAFGRLVAKYHNLVYHVVWRLTKAHSEAEDIAQEAFLKLWNNPMQVREPAALKGWLARVAHNLAMDGFRRKPPRPLDDVPEVSDNRPDAETRLVKNWAGARIDQAIAQLPDRQKLALTLVHFEHFTQTEAAIAMELSIDAFESLLARGRRTLKQQLSAERNDLFAALTEEG